jgi:murein L,D-transpeptidase YafK
MGLKVSAVARGLAAAAALIALVALAGCETDGLSSGKAMKELSAEMKAELAQKNMPLDSPVLVRLFKEEAELEVWKQDASGRFALLKTYPICRWSGELGPKVREGDRQAPEGFYNITPAQMNPNSSYYLSFNMGYPNAYDRAWGRTGSQLMVHGDCSSRGCYAMTDDQIGEIYSLARESFFGGQRSFQVQAYPFRMTAANFARHRNNPNIPFWRMLKEGNDHFELTRQEPVVEVCEKRYVFNPQAPERPGQDNGIKVGTPFGGFQSQSAQASLKFSPAGKCPAYSVPAELSAELKAKQHQDDLQIAALSTRVTAAPIRTGRDGGMNQVFLDKLKPQEVREPDGTIRYVVDEGAAKRLGSYVNPPLETYPEKDGTTGTAVASSTPAPRAAPKSSAPASNNSLYMVAASESKPAPAPARTAYASSNADNGGFFGKMKSFFVGDDEKPVPQAPVATSKPRSAPKVAAKPKPHPAPQAQEAERVAQQPSPPAQPAAQMPARQSAASGASLMSGATPTVPAGSFDSRWGAVR